MIIVPVQKTIAGRNLFRDSVSGAKSPRITYFALGSGGTMSPTAADTRLQTEAFRKAVTSYTTAGDGTILLNVYIAPLDAVGLNIAEIGIFGGSTATGAANSGVLIGRGLLVPIHTNKSNVESLQLQLQLSF